MLAQGADIVGGQLVPLVDVAADLAHPPLLLAGGGGGGGPGLDVGLIVGVGGAGGGGKHAAVQHVGQEEGVGAQVGGGHHLAAQPGVGALGDVGDAVGVLAGVGLEAGKLVRVPAGLEAEALEQVKFGLLRQDGDGKAAGLLHHVVGVVALVDGHDDAVGVGGHLDGGVGDTAVVLVPLTGGQHKQTVAQGIHDLVVHKSSPSC